MNETTEENAATTLEFPAEFCRWLSDNPAFARQVREARHQARGAARLELICVAPTALKVVKYAIHDDDISAGLKLARAMKLLDRLETAGAELLATVAGSFDCPPGVAIF
jgi:hypothetical protein